MGVVYLARDLELNRMAALKLISAEVATEEHRRRFQQEAQLASSLNHPHILAVYEAGTVEGQQYLITEFVDGVTLREWAQRDAPSLRQVLELMAGIADALAGAHQVGIVHRDVKPENILVARQGYAKLADFGLAKLVDSGSGPETDTRTDLHVRTRAGVVVGTLPYMAPEQLAGKAVDARADVFSLGVVLYELLAGQRPFGGGSALELLQAMTRGEARPLSEVRPGLPLEVCLIAEKALEKEPGERYQSMREMVLDLKRALRIKSGDRASRTVAATAPLPTMGMGLGRGGGPGLRGRRLRLASHAAGFMAQSAGRRPVHPAHGLRGRRAGSGHHVGREVRGFSLRSGRGVGGVGGPDRHRRVPQSQQRPGLR